MTAIDPKDFKHVVKVLKILCEEESFYIDKKRNVNASEKEFIWNNSDTHSKLDPEIFRLDILGNVIIKGISYSNNSKNRIFAGEYEHLKSHSNGGKSNTDNVCLLNAGINRSKSSKELHTITYYDAVGRCSVHAMRVDDFLKELKYDAHEFCEKYDLHFFIEKVNGKYTVKYKYEDEIKHEQAYNENIKKAKFGCAVIFIALAWERRYEILEFLIWLIRKIIQGLIYIKDKTIQALIYIKDKTASLFVYTSETVYYFTQGIFGCDTQTTTS